MYFFFFLFCSSADSGGGFADFFSSCSFFGEQSGDFELGIVSIAALRTERYLDHPEEDGEEEDYVYLGEKDGAGQERRSRGLFGWVTACLGL